MQCGKDDSSEHETMNQNVSWTDLYILMAIANGHERERNIQRVVRITTNALRRQIRELSSKGLIERGGRILRGWKLTEKGIDVLSSYCYQLNIPEKRVQTPVQRNETKITTTFRTGFSVTFGAILGIFVGISVVGAIASLIYWAGYNFIVKHYVPSQFLPYIPLDNPLVDVILGLITAVALFIPLRNRLNFGLLGR